MEMVLYLTMMKLQIILTFFFFTYVPYTLREDVESDGIQVASGYLGCNAIYTSPWRHNSHFYVKPQKKSVTVSMRTVAIPNLDVKV